MTELKRMEANFNQAQKMEAIGTLFSGITHDFNNILSGMVGSLHLLKKPFKPELLGRCVHDMLQNNDTGAEKSRAFLSNII